MKYLIDRFPLEACLFMVLLAIGLWLWKAPTRAQMWRWLEFQAGVNAEANEMRMRRRAERAAAMRQVVKLEAEDAG